MNEWEIGYIAVKKGPIVFSSDLMHSSDELICQLKKVDCGNIQIQHLKLLAKLHVNRNTGYSVDTLKLTCNYHNKLMLGGKVGVEVHPLAVTNNEQ